ncbi:hypothetical protein THAOC_07768, partial [Thalassiosira oceanica]
VALYRGVAFWVRSAFVGFVQGPWRGPNPPAGEGPQGPEKGGGVWWERRQRAGSRADSQLASRQPEQASQGRAERRSCDALVADSFDYELRCRSVSGVPPVDGSGGPAERGRPRTRRAAQFRRRHHPGRRGGEASDAFSPAKIGGKPGCAGLFRGRTRRRDARPTDDNGRRTGWTREVRTGRRGRGGVSSANTGRIASFKITDRSVALGRRLTQLQQQSGTSGRVGSRWLRGGKPPVRWIRCSPPPWLAGRSNGTGEAGGVPGNHNHRAAKNLASDESTNGRKANRSSGQLSGFQEGQGATNDRRLGLPPLVGGGGAESGRGRGVAVMERRAEPAEPAEPAGRCDDWNLSGRKVAGGGAEVNVVSVSRSRSIDNQEMVVASDPFYGAGEEDSALGRNTNPSRRRVRTTPMHYGTVLMRRR